MCQSAIATSCRCGTCVPGVLPRLLESAVAIRMDGHGAWRDDVFVEHPWRSVKYEEIYLRAYDSVGVARISLARYFASCKLPGRIPVGRRPSCVTPGNSP